MNDNEREMVALSACVMHSRACLHAEACHSDAICSGAILCVELFLWYLQMDKGKVFGDMQLD
jgi:hypothetical protein